MSNEVIFILFVFIPLFVLGLLMTIAQRRFLKSFREIVNPDKPISTEEVLKLFSKKVQKPEEFFKFLKGDFNNYPGVVTKLYWQHYKNPKLDKEAGQVRKFIILLIVVPLIGFLLSFLIALLK